MAVFYLGPWRIDSKARELSRDGVLRRLSPKAMRVLLMLADQPGSVVLRDELLAAVWPNVTVGEEVLTQAIAELRRRLSDDRRAPRYIETVPKSGYRLIVAATDELADLSAKSSARADAPKMTFNFDAYLLCLEADDYFEKGGQENVLTAVDRFSAAIREDPAFALAHAGLSKSLSFLYLYYVPTKTHLRLALKASERAIDLDPTSAVGHAARGMTLSAMGAAEAALASFGNAIRLDPQSFDLHYLFGRACFAEGKFELAGRALERAARLRAEDFHALALSAKTRRALGDQFNAGRLYRAAVGRIEAYRKVEPDDVRAICDLACCLVEVGDCDEALRLAESVDELDDPLTYYAACAFARAGEKSLALSHLERTVDAGWSHGSWLNRDPDLHGLRKEPRFRRIEKALCGTAS